MSKRGKRKKKIGSYRSRIFSRDEVQPVFNQDGGIIDFLENRILKNIPEEIIRQRYLRILHYDYKYPKNVMKREVPIFHGSKELHDKNNNPIRADIVIYENKKACENRDQGKIRFVVECKAPTETEGHNQLISYIFNTSANGGVWYNGSGENDQVQYFRRYSEPEQKLVRWLNIPRHKESWDAIGRRKKSDLITPKDIKGILRRCHNRLHRIGSEEDDLTMDMVRIILAKTMDEEQEGEWPDFYSTPEEYSSSTGREAVAKRISDLFEKVKWNNLQVFEEHEKINVGKDQVVDVVVELQDYRLMADENDDRQWDLMGIAYEEYTSIYLKKKRGQFFTNRLIVDLLVKMVDPRPEDIILDPAGGSGGFINATMRYVRNNIDGSSRSNAAKRIALGRLKSNLFMVEISKRLVKVAKTAMILNGDGHAGFTQGNSLGKYEDLDPIILTKSKHNFPDVILTNPPWAGIGEGRITDKSILENFKMGKIWHRENGELKCTSEYLTDGVPPELLFIERCIDWLTPEGGILGIVLPKGVLDTDTALVARHLIFMNTKVLAVINCHKNTFQPFTGPRPCLLVVEKRDSECKISNIENYKIFMGINRKIGQDSEGVPIFKLDDQGNKTDEIDYDLEEIFEKFLEFKEGRLVSSEYVFSINFNDIDPLSLKINPQFYLPSLNQTVKEILQMDGKDGWNVIELSQISKDARIFKPPRLKSENLVIEDPDDTTALEAYYTPSTILQNKNESIKWFDLNLTNATQDRTISILRLQKDEILITRSGSIGRIAYVTSNLVGVIGSDDLIRVRIPNEELRHYVYYYLRSKAGQDQMKKNEYGSIQQHLEAKHIREILIPIPDDLSVLKPIIQNSKEGIKYLEKSIKSDDSAQNEIDNLIQLS